MAQKNLRNSFLQGWGEWGIEVRGGRAGGQNLNTSIQSYPVEMLIVIIIIIIITIIIILLLLLL